MLNTEKKAPVDVNQGNQNNDYTNNIPQSSAIVNAEPVNQEIVTSMTTGCNAIHDNRLRTFFFNIIRYLASRSGCKGKLVIASYGQNPVTGQILIPKVSNFPIDTDFNPIVEQLMPERHRNIYMPLCLMKSSLKATAKGTEDDIEAVLGLCADFDDKDAANYFNRLPMPPDFVIETSKGRFQAFYFFNVPVTKERAKTLAIRLQAFANCDHGTKDLSHVWRIPDTWNWPNKKKVDEGRSPEPQHVKAIAWPGTYVDVDEFERRLGEVEPITAQATPMPSNFLNFNVYNKTSLKVLKIYIDNLPPIFCDEYHKWIEVGMVLHYETDGSDDGYEVFDTWSKRSPNYVSKEDTRNKWDSFTVKNDNKQLTTGSIIFWLKEANAFEKTNTQVQEELRKMLDGTPQGEIEASWVVIAANLDPAPAQVFIRQIASKADVGINILKQELKNYKALLKRKRTEQQRQNASQERQNKGIKDILINDREMSSTLKQMEEFCDGIFVHTGSLVIVANEQPTSISMIKKSREQGVQYPTMPIIKPLKKESLRLALEKTTQCCCNSQEGPAPCQWPDSYLNTMLQGFSSKIPPLTGIVEHPFVDDNFNIMTQQGYDPSTGLYITFNNLESFVVNREFDQQDAIESYNYLTDSVFADFPFVNDIAKAAAVSALLTAIQRKILSTTTGCPAYLLDAPDQASGKTTLAQVISSSIYGRPVAATSFTTDEVELGKHILAILMEGQSCVLFDNIEQGTTIDSARLATAITNETFTDRVLGANRNGSAPTQVLWLFTGNNINLKGDFKSRILSIRLEATEVRRTFTRLNVVDWCIDNRISILQACLTIILAAKGLKTDLKPHRFTEWDKFVRQPIYNASGHDIASMFDDNERLDPETETQAIFFEELLKQFDKNAGSMTAHDIAEKAGKGGTFFTALQGVMPRLRTENNPSAREVGYVLRSLKGKTINGLRLEAKTITTHKNKNKQGWSIRKM